jgi:hypothetical protein
MININNLELVPPLITSTWSLSRTGTDRYTPGLSVLFRVEWAALSWLLKESLLLTIYHCNHHHYPQR